MKGLTLYHFIDFLLPVGSIGIFLHVFRVFLDPFEPQLKPIDKQVYCCILFVLWSSTGVILLCGVKGESLLSCVVDRQVLLDIYDLLIEDNLQVHYKQFLIEFEVFL